MITPLIPPPVVRYYSGLDLGQTSDPSALAVLEQTQQPDPAKPDRQRSHYTVRHLERFALGTSYLSICAQVVARFVQPPLAGSALGVDQTGVGRAVVDILRKTPPRATLVPITITSGQNDSRDATTCAWHVAKKNLVAALQVPLQGRRLKVVPTLPEAKTLVKELQNFRVKITLAANETFEAWRDGLHDDLVLAVAMAVWLGERGFGQGSANVPPEGSPGRFEQPPPGVFHSEDFPGYSW